MEVRRSNSNVRDGESVASFDSTGKKKSFRRLFSRFAEKTSMQGVAYINMARFWWAKVIWVILLLGAVAVMTLHLWYLFDQYFSWPINTKVDLGFRTLTFPQVTICNTNVMHRTRFEEYDGSEELHLLVHDMNPENFFWEQDYDGTTGDWDQGTTNQIGPGTTVSSFSTQQVLFLPYKMEQRLSLTEFTIYIII